MYSYETKNPFRKRQYISEKKSMRLKLKHKKTKKSRVNRGVTETVHTTSELLKTYIFSY